MLRSEGQQDALLRSGGLKLEIELAAEPLAKRKPPRPIHAASEWRMQDELHPSRIVKESFEDQGVTGGKRSEQALGVRKIFDDLARSGLIDPDFFDEPATGSLFIGQAPADLLPNIGNGFRELDASRGRFPEPE